MNITYNRLAVSILLVGGRMMALYLSQLI